MSLGGDLKDISIVDVIQLLNTTRKSGTLCVKRGKGECRIVFDNGYVVGATHPKRDVHIGTVLVDMNAVTPEVIEQALEEQKKAGDSCKPLIAMLIEEGKIKREEASKGLEKLIVTTAVELVGWTKGAFTFDLDATALPDEYRYFSEEMNQEICLDTQMLLMDALRIFDELKRDGRYEEEEYEEEGPPEGVAEIKGTGLTLSADDLGLADIDKLEKKIPEVFSGIKAFDPAEIHRQIIRETLTDFSTEEQEKFVSFLKRFSVSADETHAKQEGPAHGIILFSRDELIKHSLMTVCKEEGILVFTTDEEEDIDYMIGQCRSRGIVPLLVFDSPEKTKGGLPGEKVVSLRQRVKEMYPRVSKIQLASPYDYTFSLQSFHDGVRAVFPRQLLKEARKETFIEDTIRFLETFQAYIKGFFHEQRQQLTGKLKGCITDLRDLKEAPDVSLALLNFVSEMFERSITLVVRKTDLMAERGIGVKAEKSEGVTPAMKFRIPLTKPSVFRDVIEEGHLFYGESDDEILKEHLFKEIGAPLGSTILLLPIESRGKVIALIYGDFGQKEASPVQIDGLEILASQAGLVLENSLYRKQLESASQQV